MIQGRGEEPAQPNGVTIFLNAIPARGCCVCSAALLEKAHGWLYIVGLEKSLPLLNQAQIVSDDTFGREDL